MNKDQDYHNKLYRVQCFNTRLNSIVMSKSRTKKLVIYLVFIYYCLAFIFIYARSYVGGNEGAGRFRKYDVRWHGTISTT